MTDLSRHIQDNNGIEKAPTAETRAPQTGESRTAGENRDFDQSGTSDNQAHGHPREEHLPQTGRAAENTSEATGGRKGRPESHTGDASGVPGGDQGMPEGTPNTSGGERASGSTRE